MSDLTLAALVSVGIVVVFGIAVVANLVLSGWFGRNNDD
jgi:hypothetical protein